MLIALLQVKQQSVNVDLVTPGTLTQTVGLTLASLHHVDNRLYARITEELPSVNAHLNILEIHMYHVAQTHVFRMLVGQMRIAHGVVNGHCVSVDLDILEVPIVGLVAELTLARKGSVVKALSVKMLEVDLYVSVCQGTRVTPIQAVSRANVMKIQTVDPNAHVKITNVWTPVQYLVVKELIVLSKTMLPFVGVQEEQPEIPSETAGGSQEKKYVLHVALTLIARLEMMTDPSAGVKTHTLETPSKDVVMNVTVTTSVDNPNNVTDGLIGVNLPAPVAFAVRMQIANL